MPYLVAFLCALTFGAGCGPVAHTETSKVAKLKVVKLIDAAGSGQDVTTSFVVQGSGVRIDYRLVRQTPDRQLTLVVERDSGSGVFGAAASSTVSVADDLKGSESIALIPGSYRLRVKTDVTWSAVVSELRP